MSNAAQMYTRTLEQGSTFDISLSLAPGVVLLVGEPEIQKLEKSGRKVAEF